MADVHQPKKETVRIALPPSLRESRPGSASSDTVRIPVAPSAVISPEIRPPAAVSSTPVRPPTINRQAAPTAGSASTTVMPPRPRVLPPPPRVLPLTATPPSSVSAAPSNYPGSATQSGPKQDTARISILPEPAIASPTREKMTKTQPLFTAPPPKPLTTPIVHSPIQSAPPADDHAIPMPLLWAACGISAVTLIIQIWNYFGS